MKKANRWLSPFSVLVLAFLYIPMFVLVLFSFNASRINAEWKGFTFEWYASLLENDQVIDAFVNSMTIATLSCLISTAIGTLAAIALHRYRFKFQLAWNGFMYLPIVLPDILMGLSLLILFNQLGIDLGIGTILIAHVTFSIPFVYVIVSTRLEQTNQDLEAAAYDLGATPWQAFRYITLPVLAPSIVSSVLLSFSLSLDDFIISFFVAGPGSTTLPIYIYGMVKRGVTPEVNALAALLMIMTLLAVGLGEVVRRLGERNRQAGSETE